MKEEYLNPRVELWELTTGCALCGSVVKDGAVIDGLEKDDDFEWF